MLILERKCDERIMIGDEIALAIIDVRRGSVRIGITAHPEVPIIRDELICRRPGRPLASPVRRPFGKKQRNGLHDRSPHQRANRAITRSRLKTTN